MVMQGGMVGMRTPRERVRVRCQARISGCRVVSIDSPSPTYCMHWDWCAGSGCVRGSIEAPALLEEHFVRREVGERALNRGWMAYRKPHLSLCGEVSGVYAGDAGEARAEVRGTQSHDAPTQRSACE
jgi:hypothetical protein